MKRFFAFTLFIFIQCTYAQQEVFVSGQVIDSITNHGLESCTIGFFNTKQVLVTGTTTDSKGYFEIGLQPGKYQMILDYIGYLKISMQVIIRKNNQFLGTFRLSPDDNLLKSVEIKAKSKAFKVDKDVYVISRKMKVAAANTNDVLDKIQGVNYDRYNNQIKVDGQTNIKILVDGLEKSPDYIRNLNPDRLKKVEIIRDPAGKYALDGYTAVINIILKKNYTGLELNLSSQSIWDTDVSDKSHLIPTSYANAGLTYTYNKINIYTQYNFHINDFNFPTTSIYNYQDGSSIQKLNGETNNMLKMVLVTV